MHTQWIERTMSLTSKIVSSLAFSKKEYFIFSLIDIVYASVSKINHKIAANTDYQEL